MCLDHISQKNVPEITEKDTPLQRLLYFIQIKNHNDEGRFLRSTKYFILKGI
jgi:hypothetical protein